MHVSLGEHRGSAPIVRVDRQGLFKQAPRVIDRRFCASVHMQEVRFCAAQKIVIGLPGCRGLQQGPIDFSTVHMGHENRDNRTRNLVLDREHVVKLAVVSVGPPVGAGRGLDKLRRDADALAAPPNAPLEQVARTQLPPDLPEIDRLALVVEG